MFPPSPYVYALCQVGLEKVLKDEVKARHPELRPAFMRPGLITWKADAPLPPDFRLRAVFQRAHGFSVGGQPDEDTLLARIRELVGSGRVVLHVAERDRHAPNDEPPEYPFGAEARALEARLRERAPELFHERTLPELGETVLDVVVGEGDRPLLGYHVHDRFHPACAGGRLPVVLPPEAPSRAYLKAAEALAWTGFDVREGDVAVEIGSSPGGVTYALLERGLSVIGIDPGAMAPNVLAYGELEPPRFRHLDVPVAQVPREALPKSVDWLLLDANIAPQVSLRQAQRLVAMLRPTLRGVFFTLKLNGWPMAQKAEMLAERVGSMGLENVRAAHLHANRMEFSVFAENPRRPCYRRSLRG